MSENNLNEVETKLLKVPCTLEITESDKVIVRAELVCDMPNYHEKYVKPMARALKMAATIAQASLALLVALEDKGGISDAAGNVITPDCTEERRNLRNILAQLRGAPIDE